MDCGDCKFFRQHYVISSGRYMALDYGHCVARCRTKMYAADTTACERYEQSTGETLPPESEARLPEQANRGQLLSVLWETGVLRPGQVSVQLKSAADPAEPA